MNAPFQKPLRMGIEEFVVWADRQAGRHELFEGEVRTMTPEQMGHIRLKTRFSRLLEMAAKSSPVPCEAIADGMAVAIGERTFLVPDAMLRCGNPLPDTATRATDPVVIVEVLSPSNTAEEMAFKFEQYFSLPTLVHHLEVNPVSRSILH
jgi:Uma2 family endonuclease